MILARLNDASKTASDVAVVLIVIATVQGPCCHQAKDLASCNTPYACFHSVISCLDHRSGILLSLCLWLTLLLCNTCRRPSLATLTVAAVMLYCLTPLLTPVAAAAPSMAPAMIALSSPCQLMSDGPQQCAAAAHHSSSPRLLRADQPNRIRRHRAATREASAATHTTAVAT